MPVLRNLVLDGATRLSQGPRPERAQQDAETLLLELLHKNKAWLLTHPDNQISASAANRIHERIDRRFRGEPIQYITGEAEFYGLPFRVTPDVLIPRPETEHLVEKVIDLAANYAEPRIVDVGTGSGIIAVALAHHLPHALITATDLSSSALAIAQENAERNGVSGRIRFIEGDLLAPVAEERFEIVVSNPPYVPEVDRSSLAVEVRDYEPALALFAGDDGLKIYHRLIPAAFAALTPGGYAALEIGFSQSPAIGALLATSGFSQIQFVPDLNSILRIASAQKR